MSKMIVLQGCPASGKSTWAKEFIKDKPNWVIVSRDEIREGTGKYWVPSRENYISDIEEFSIRAAINRNLNVIVDATNLNQKTIDKLTKLATELKVDIEYKKFVISFNEAYWRDTKRTRKVGLAVLRRFFNTYFPDMSQEIVNQEKESPAKERFILKQDETLLHAIICDIDGTLSLMNGRGPFEYHRVNEDLPNNPVIDLVNSLSKMYQIIIVTGREDTEVCRKETLKWLNRYLTCSDFLFYMRKEKDYRKDAIVKTEIYNEHIKDKYCVAAIFDDRTQVVEGAWRKLGLLCNQVWKGDF